MIVLSSWQKLPQIQQTVLHTVNVHWKTNAHMQLTYAGKHFTKNNSVDQWINWTDLCCSAQDIRLHYHLTLMYHCIQYLVTASYEHVHWYELFHWLLLCMDRQSSIASTNLSWQKLIASFSTKTLLLITASHTLASITQSAYHIPHTQLTWGVHVLLCAVRRL